MECLFCDFFHYQEDVLEHVRTVHGERKYYLTATNGLIVSNQCRKCGLGGAKRSHFGPVNNEKCVLVKYKLRKEKIKPIFPPVEYLRNADLLIVGRDETKMRSPFVSLDRFKLEDAAKFAKSINCPICGLVCKNKKDACSKIKQHILSRHRLAHYKCNDCLFDSTWPAQLSEHCEQEHDRKILPTETAGENFSKQVRYENLVEEFEIYFPADEREPVEAPLSLPTSTGIDLEKKEIEIAFQVSGDTQEEETPETSPESDEVKDKPQVVEDIVLIPRSPKYSAPTTRKKAEASKPTPSSRDIVNCPFCKMTCSRRGIIQHVNYSHADSYKKFRTCKEYMKILPLKCSGCNMLFAGNESLRKHYQRSTCIKPDSDEDAKEPEPEYTCPLGCKFHGKLHIILTHMYRHPEANIRFRLKKSHLLPVKCHACNFHYTTRSSLSKHLEKNRCEKNIELQNQYAAPKSEQKEIVSEDNFLRCPYKCGRMYTSQSKLDNHIQKSHKAEADQESMAAAGTILKSLRRESGDGKYLCPIGDCGFGHRMFSLLSTHVRKNHKRDNYVQFRTTPTTESPFVCKGCGWAFTEGQIKNHFHEAKAVCTRNRKWKQELLTRDSLPVLKLNAENIPSADIKPDTPPAVPETVQSNASEANPDEIKTSLPAADVTKPEEKPAEPIGPEKPSERPEEGIKTPDKQTGQEAEVEDNIASANNELQFVPVENVNKERTVTEAEDKIPDDSSIVPNEPAAKEDLADTSSSKILISEQIVKPTEEDEEIVQEHFTQSSAVENTESEKSTSDLDEEVRNNSIINSECEDNDNDQLLGMCEITVENVESITIEQDENDAPDILSIDEDATVKHEPICNDEIESTLAKEEHGQKRPRTSKPYKSGLPSKRMHVDIGALLLRTLNPYPKSFKFDCNNCAYKSERIMDLSQHMQQSHTTSDYIRFRSTSRYLPHQCSACGYRCMSEDQLTRHQQLSQQKNCSKFKAFRLNFGVTIDSDGTELMIMALNSKLDSEKAMNSEIVFRCPFCPRIFVNITTDLLPHVAHAHNVENYAKIRLSDNFFLNVKCEVCKWNFETDTQQERHAQQICELQQTLTQRFGKSEAESSVVKSSFRCPFCDQEINSKEEIVEHVDKKHPDFAIIYRLKASEVLKEKCSSCGWHFITQQSLQQHNGEQCRVNNQKKQQFLYGLEGGETRTTNSPSFSTGRDSRLSFGSDTDSPKPSQSQSFPSNAPFGGSKRQPISQSVQFGSNAVPHGQIYYPHMNPQVIQYQQMMHTGGPYQIGANPYYQQNNRLQMDAYQQKMYFRQQQYFSQQAGNQKNQVQSQVQSQTAEKYLVNVLRPNNFDPTIYGCCSYCFMPMRSQQDVVRHSRTIQECYAYAQGIVTKCTWPCPYCGFESNGPSKFLQQHIQSAHPSGLTSTT